MEERQSNDWAARSELALHPLLSSWHYDCYGLEGTPENNWRWCGTSGELQVENSLPRTRQVNMEMTLYVPNEGNFHIDSKIINDKWIVKTKPAVIPISKKFSLPPGTHKIKFISDSPKGVAPRDPRVLVFRIDNFTLVDAN